MQTDFDYFREDSTTLFRHGFLFNIANYAFFEGAIPWNQDKESQQASLHRTISAMTGIIPNNQNVAQSLLEKFQN